MIGPNLTSSKTLLYMISVWISFLFISNFSFLNIAMKTDEFLSTNTQDCRMVYSSNAVFLFSLFLLMIEQSESNIRSSKLAFFDNPLKFISMFSISVCSHTPVSSIGYFSFSILSKLNSYSNIPTLATILYLYGTTSPTVYWLMIVPGSWFLMNQRTSPRTIPIGFLSWFIFSQTSSAS